MNNNELALLIEEKLKWNQEVYLPIFSLLGVLAGTGLEVAKENIKEGWNSKLKGMCQLLYKSGFLYQNILYHLWEDK